MSASPPVDPAAPRASLLASGLVAAHAPQPSMAAQYLEENGLHVSLLLHLLAQTRRMRRSHIPGCSGLPLVSLCSAAPGQPPSASSEGPCTGPPRPPGSPRTPSLPSPFRLLNTPAIPSLTWPQGSHLPCPYPCGPGFCITRLPPTSHLGPPPSSGAQLTQPHPCSLSQASGSSHSPLPPRPFPELPQAVHAPPNPTPGCPWSPLPERSQSPTQPRVGLPASFSLEAGPGGQGGNRREWGESSGRRSGQRSVALGARGEMLTREPWLWGAAGGWAGRGGQGSHLGDRGGGPP